MFVFVCLGSMCLGLCVWLSTCERLCTSAYVYVCICVCRSGMSGCTHVYMYGWVHSCVHVRTCIYVYVCACVWVSSFAGCADVCFVWVSMCVYNVDL